MKTLDIMAIPLTQGLYALVDGEDYERLSRYKWYAAKSRNTYYARRSENTKGRTIDMHQEILIIPKGMQTDHRNHYGLDNRKQNLRICTNAQNQHNKLPQSGGSSQYKGVNWEKVVQKWHSCIWNKNKNINLGYFNSEMKAAKAYDKKARELFGEFAYLNFV